MLVIYRFSVKNITHTCMRENHFIFFCDFLPASHVHVCEQNAVSSNNFQLDGALSGTILLYFCSLEVEMRTHFAGP
jgi:hypothetical protein